MKRDRHGKARTLDPDQLNELLYGSTLDDKYRLLFGICYFASCRVSEALQLRVEDVGETITFRRATTKEGNTRQIPMHPKIRELLDGLSGRSPTSGYLFPGRDGRHLTRRAADIALRKAADYIGLQGISTHSFRRSAITRMAGAGVPLSHIQARSGHASLANLQKYVDVTEQQVRDAGAVL